MSTETNPAGRPTKYKIEYNRQVFRFCLVGAIDKEIADFLEVNQDTINEWKNKYPKFSEPLKRGKLTADANVSNKLFERAISFKHPDIDVKMFKGKIILTKITKHYPPDTTAAIFWLKIGLKIGAIDILVNLII